MARRRQTQPVRAPSGGAYGDRKALEQAQTAVPLPQQPTPAPMPVPDQTQRHAAAMQTAAQMPGFGALLDGPSRRPYEPVTNGLAAGLGAGPAALGERPSTISALQALADQTGDPDVEYLAEIAGRLGL